MSVCVAFVVDKVERFLSEFFGFPLSVLFYRDSAYSYVIWSMINRPIIGNRPNIGRSLETYSNHTDVNSNKMNF
jgi:hypothetical protein